MFIMCMRDNHYRLVIEVDDFTPDEDLDQINRDLTVADLERYTKACLHPETKFRVIENFWLICYRINERRAENYIHKGRIFLGGDAAHVHSPAGGQGMNTGLQDSYNLAWKLALVMNKLAPASLLQTYHDERLPMADRAIELSSRLLDRARDKGPVLHYIKRFFLIMSPLLMYIKSLFFPRESAMVMNTKSTTPYHGLCRCSFILTNTHIERLFPISLRSDILPTASTCRTSPNHSPKSKLIKSAPVHPTVPSSTSFQDLSLRTFPRSTRSLRQQRAIKSVSKRCSWAWASSTS